MAFCESFLNFKFGPPDNSGAVCKHMGSEMKIKNARKCVVCKEAMFTACGINNIAVRFLKAWNGDKLCCIHWHSESFYRLNVAEFPMGGLKKKNCKKPSMFSSITMILRLKSMRLEAVPAPL